MFDASSLLEDANFQLLASYKNGAEEFARLLTEHVRGYTQKKRLADGLKELNVKVEAVESKQIYAQSVGKAKQLDAEDQALINKYSSHDLKEKLQNLNALTQAMIDEGQLTPTEKPQVLESLRARLAAAKAADKTKQAEKLDTMLSVVVKVVPVSIPVRNLSEIHSLNDNLEEVQHLEKRVWKNLTGAERDKVNRKQHILDEIKAMRKLETMWFETEEESNPRFQHALAMHAKMVAERRKLEEEQAMERRRLEEEQALDQKRLAKIEKEEREHRELMAKLEAKRLEALANPSNAISKPKPKEKARVVKLDNTELFDAVHNYELPADNKSDEEEYWEDEALEQSRWEEDTSASLEKSAGRTTATEPTAKKATAKPRAPAKPKVKVELECKWDTVAPAQLQEPDDSTGPSLAEAVKAPAQAPSGQKPLPQPAGKKEKKKFTKLDPHQLFDGTPNFLLPVVAEKKVEVETTKGFPTAPQGPVVKSPAATSLATSKAAPVQQRKLAPPKPVIESKWGAAPEEAGEQEEQEEQEEPVDFAGPSLMDAVAAPAKEKKEKLAPQPQPKKKVKQKMAKMDLGALGFDF